MSPERTAAWQRYYDARLDILSAGALVAALVDAYEELERTKEIASSLRSQMRSFCVRDTNKIERLLDL